MFTVMRGIMIIGVQKKASSPKAFMKPQKSYSTDADHREALLMEEAYLLYLNDYVFATGRISEKDYVAMVRRIKSRTYNAQKVIKDFLEE